MKSTHCQRKIGQAAGVKRKVPGYFLRVLMYYGTKNVDLNHRRTQTQDPALPCMSPVNMAMFETLEN